MGALLRREREKNINMKTDQKAAAIAFARDAHENHFPSRRGSWCIEGRPQIVLYDNNPYKWRDAEHKALRAWMKKQGIEILAEGSFPQSGESKGYTTAWILKADHDRAHDIGVRWKKILGEVHELGIDDCWLATNAPTEILGVAHNATA